MLCAYRVLRLLERAPRSIRLVADAEPLQVVYEDAYFLAVSKPPGLRSAPVHRFMGGSAVNRMIGYLRAEPYLLHRCGRVCCRCCVLAESTEGVVAQTTVAVRPASAAAVVCQLQAVFERGLWSSQCVARISCGTVATGRGSAVLPRG